MTRENLSHMPLVKITASEQKNITKRLHELQTRVLRKYRLSIKTRSK